MYLYIRIIYSDSVIHIYIYVPSAWLYVQIYLFVCLCNYLFVYLFFIIGHEIELHIYIQFCTGFLTVCCWFSLTIYRSVLLHQESWYFGLLWAIQIQSPFLQQEIWLKIRRPPDLAPQKVLQQWRRLKPVDQPCFPQLQLDGRTLVV